MYGLFEVWKRHDDYLERTGVYAVRDDKSGYPHFLIYEDNQWKYVSAKHFLPCDKY